MENITKAIQQVMKDVNNIAKNTTVGSGKNSYKAVSEKDVKQVIRSSMITNGLCIMQTGIQRSECKIDRWEEEVQKYNSQETTLKTKQSVFTDVIVEYSLIHTSGEAIKLTGYGQGIDSQDKGAGKATTYSLKNLLLNIFLVPTGEDTDNTHSEDIEQPQSKAVERKITLDEVDTKWNGKIYGKNMVYINGEKVFIPQDQVERLKAHEKYVELPDKKK